LQPFIRQGLDRAQQSIAQHRRGVLAAIVTLLGGFGITAFGIAPLAPDAADLPRMAVTQPVELHGIEAQLEQIAGERLTLWRSEVTRAHDSADSLLRRLGAADAGAAAFLRSDKTARRLFAGRNKAVQARIDGAGSLVELVARFPAEGADAAKIRFNRLQVRRTEGGFVARVETAALETRVRLASGTIRSSLFAATDEADLPDTVAAQLAEIFAADIDFHRELRRGDTFSVVYETLVADGEPVSWGEGAGRVLAAEFVNNGKAYHALWFSTADGRGAYFGLDGTSRRKAFLASPLEFSRMTSGFAMRFHPLQRSWRQHLGVDYAAPSGTTVRSVGAGTVEFAGWRNGYGKVVEVRHDKDRSTLYAHLSALTVKPGQRVEQGEHVGAVGATGWATGPHLHFEFRVKGEHQDPLIVAKAAEHLQLDVAALRQFAQVAGSLQAKLDIAETLASARRRIE
jgi:murein DD-endopeptidase MepM/ murein hydrolase activator NlpD